MEGDLGSTCEELFSLQNYFLYIIIFFSDMARVQNWIPTGMLRRRSAKAPGNQPPQRFCEVTSLCGRSMEASVTKSQDSTFAGAHYNLDAFRLF